MGLKVSHVSVLTPSWNRGHLLERVWQGLDTQTYRDFEWVVANDGSDDDTDEVVKELAERSDFPVVLINASCRVGKARMDNELIKAARGDFMIWCDSDDQLMPEALETLIDTWESIPLEKRDAFCGVSALNRTPDGILGNRFYETDKPFDIEWNEMYSRLQSDLTIFTRAELLKAQRFLEVDFMIPESTVWSKIGILKTRFIPSPLRWVHYRSPNALSSSGDMSHNRAHAYAAAITRDIKERGLGRPAKFYRAVTFLRYARHGEISFRKARRMWGNGATDLFGLIAASPIAEILASRDRLMGKVRKTHRDFERANKVVEIRSRRL